MIEASSAVSNPIVVLSDRAYTEIINETLQNIRTETGGILLGVKEGEKWYVVESLDPGPNSILQSSYFQYDDRYVTHLANKVRNRYRANLRLLGLWHRHPGSFDQFSRTDDGTNATYVSVCGGAAISGLVNIDPDFRMTFYMVVGEQIRYKRAAVVIGDSSIPNEFLLMKSAQSLLDSILSATRKSSSTSVPNLMGQTVKMLPKPANEESIKLAEQQIQHIRKGWDWLMPWRHGRDSRTPADVYRSQRIEGEMQDAAMEMVLEELDYLDEQSEYSYELSPGDGVVRVVLTRALNNRECPQQIELIFAFTADGRSVTSDNSRYAFQPGITKFLVNRAIMSFSSTRI